MDEKNIEVLIVTDPSNMSWLTGYDGWSFYVHQCVVLTLEGEPLWYGRGMDTNGAKRTVFMQNENIIGYADDYVQNPRKHPMDYLSEIFREKGWAEKTIGVEKDNYYFSASCLESLQKNLPESSFTDATGLVNWQRTVKSNQELEYMRKAARIVEKMYERILEVIEPGMRKNDLVAEIYHSGISGVEGAGGDYPAIVPVTPTGADASAPHLTWDDKKIPDNCAIYGVSVTDLNQDGDLDMYISTYRSNSFRYQMFGMDRKNIKFSFKFENGKRVISGAKHKLTGKEYDSDRFYINSTGRILESGVPDYFIINENGNRLILKESSQVLGVEYFKNIPRKNWGLGSIFADINNDYLDDLYVCNDLEESDYFIVSDGTRFRDGSMLVKKNSPMFSMGIDVADINNDQKSDVFICDMLNNNLSERRKQMHLSLIHI